MKSAIETSYYDRVTFKEDNTFYMLCNRQLITLNRVKVYSYDVYTSTNDESYFFSSKVFVKARIAQKRSCKAIYEEILNTECA